MSPCRAAFLPALLLLLSAYAVPAAAQTVRGRVIDATTGQPVPEVQVSLLRADSARIERVLTDVQGQFLFNARNEGSYRLSAEHIAYTSVATEVFPLAAREDLEVVLRLTTSAIALDPLAVIARRNDARHEMTYAGLYARHRLYPPLGNRRVWVPHDTEMMVAQDVQDVLRWSVPIGRRGCTTVYWNGRLMANEMAAEFVLATPVNELEGIEYYRSPYDAPFDFRDIPPYQLENAGRCSVVALWLRTGVYEFETSPRLLPEPPPWYPRVHAVVYHIEGLHAPAPGVGVEATSHTAFLGPVQLGAVLRVSLHGLSPATTEAMTATLSDGAYRLPPGRRMLMLTVLGGEARVPLIQRDGLSVAVGARMQVAQRRFSLATPIVHDDARQVTSYGAGPGFTIAAEKRLGARTFLNAGIGHDRLSFRRYDEIERSYNPTAARWSGTAVRLGILYDLTQH